TEALDDFEDQLADLRRLDDKFGGRELYPVAVAKFQRLSRFAGDLDSAGSLRPRLFGLVTEAACACGWSHYDAGFHAASDAYYQTALRASEHADDVLMRAHVMTRMSLQAMLAGNSR